MLLAGSARAQPLSAFVDAAAHTNIDARAAEVATARARAEAGQSWGALLPSLTANAGWARNQFDAVIDVPTGPTTTQQITIIPTNQLEATFKVELPLIDASKWLRASSAVIASDAAAQRQAANLDAVKRQVVTAYYLYAGTRALVASTQRSLTVAQAQLEQQTARRAAGAATELEVTRAQAEIERARQLVADAEAQLANAARALRTLSGIEPTDVPPLEPDDLHPEPALAELERRVDILANVRAAELDVSAASRAWVAAATTLVPSVNAQFTQRFTNATGFQNQAAVWNGGLAMNWRLDAVGLHGVRIANANEQTAALSAERARSQAVDQIHNDWQRVRAALTKASAAKAQVVAATRAAALARERNSAGVATQLDVIQSDRDVLAAEVSDIQARFDVAAARASLHLSAGLPVEAAR